MTHFKTVVVLPDEFEPNRSSDASIREAVAVALAPYYEGDEMFQEGSRWDWYSVGGRWDGEIRDLSWKDNIVVCRLCQGTGERPGGLEQFGQAWYNGCNGCNGCSGTGEVNDFFSGASKGMYESLERNIATVLSVPPDYEFSTFVDPQGQWHEVSRMGWFGMTIDDENGLSEKVGPFDQAWTRVQREHPNNIVVAVDCHV